MEGFLVKQPAAPPPDPHNSVGYTGGNIHDVRYFACLFRGERLERKAGPFMTVEAAAAAFLPVPVWPRLQPWPR
jgi:hypothetical protein